MTKAKAPAQDVTLIIAEKPSVAADLVKVLGSKSFKKETTYYESSTTIVSWALGHLVTIADPKEIDERYKAWKMETLPIIPDTFKLDSIKESRSQLTALGKLIRRKDVKTIVNACDAGREGELIFYYILEFVKTNSTKDKVIKRLWMQSMTPAAIKEAFANLRTAEDMEKLKSAALCRSEADWLVGINGSRGLTAYNSSLGGFRITPCGRVQTPTLAMIVKREEERHAFEPRQFWSITADFDNSGNEYQGKWFQEKGKDTEKQIFDQKKVEEILKKCKGKTGTVEETTKPSQQFCGPLYDLTTLQREANNRFGFSAKTTLSIAQALYERHKATTYPRTDSKALPEDYVAPVKETLGKINGSLSKFAEEALNNGWVKKNPKIFDNSKISDHHAIIPTGVMPSNLSEAEQKIFNMICQRFIAVFYPPAKYLNTTRVTTVEGETFITEGKILVEPGFKAVYGKDTEAESNIPPLKGDAKAKVVEINAKEDFTKPPARYTESTLLSMMESAGKLVEDDDLRDAMKERGLGTPATRAATIEKLVSDKYIVRDGKDLVPTAKSFDLIKVLSAMDIEVLTSPELTGEWEYKLGLIEKGSETRENFMKGIQDLTRQMVKNIKGFKEDDTRKEASFSPVAGKKIFETVSRYETEDGIIIKKIFGGKKLSEEEIKELLTNKKIGPLPGFRSKRGSEFSAVLVITEQNKVEFVFDTKPETVEVTGEPVGYSPVDNSPVFETLTNYISESAINKEPSGITLPKVLLGKEISLDNIKKLLAGEKTDLIKGLRSSKTHRLFDAFLSLDKNGKLKFEFPPRAAGTGKRFFRKGAAAKKEE